MIFFISDGRLGNQLFQLALLNAIAKPKETVHCYRMNAFQTTFELKNKHIQIHSYGKLKRNLMERLAFPFMQFLIRLGLLKSIKQIRENGQSFPELLIQNPNRKICWVQTHFFQSEHFFKGTELPFQIKAEFTTQAKEILRSKAPKGVPVFIHLRRKDYLAESYNGEKDISLPFEYYQKAIKRMQERVENPTYIILSDDPVYAKEKLSFVNSAYFSDESMQTDLALMSLCHHGIISNSSFSWWRAYLMEKKGELIAPKYWYGWKTKKQSHLGICPNFALEIDF